MVHGIIWWIIPFWLNWLEFRTNCITDCRLFNSLPNLLHGLRCPLPRGSPYLESIFDPGFHPMVAFVTLSETPAERLVLAAVLRVS
jgi:hypothetical protein